MTKPVTIPNTFATATTAIPLSNLDADFSTVATAMNDANTYSNYAADTGSANAYVVTLTGISAIYSAGLRIQFKAGNANTTASTLNVNAQGAKNITYQDASAIASGTIAANSIVDVMYDGTQFLLMNDPAGATGGDVVGPASATDNAIVRFDGTTGKLVQNSVVTIADSTGDISGVGQLNATTVDTTNLEVTNIKAKDGTAAASIADSTGVITVTAAPVMSALTASQAVFTTAGKALTSNAITGTGNVVMSASPTLTGTISAAAATLSSDLTLNGGTANGVLYLNGSKVATSGAALTFDGTTLTGNAAYGTATAAIVLKNTSGPSSSNIVEQQFFASNSFSGLDTIAKFGALNPSAGANNYGAFYWSLANAGSPAELMRLTSTGLGIGQSSPTGKLDVAGDAGVYVRPTGVSGTYLQFTAGAANGNTNIIASANSGGYPPLVFQTGGGEKMRLDSSGNLGIGTSSPAYKLDVRSSSGTSPVTYISNGSTSGNVEALRTSLESNGNNTSSYHLNAVTQTVNNWYLYGNGTTSFSSDERLKKDIETTRDGYLDDVMKLRVVKYRWWNQEESEPRELGLIAQEVEQVFPGLVQEHELEGVGMRKNIKHSVMEFILIKAIQELKSELDSVKAELAILKGN